MLRWQHVVVCALVFWGMGTGALNLGVPSANAQIFVLSDIDGTLFEYRSAYHGTFNTAIELYRVHDRGLPLGPEVEKVGPETIQVSIEEFERLEKTGGLARGEGRLGSASDKIVTLDGKSVTAGYYMFVYPNSYERFYGAGQHATALVDDLTSSFNSGRVGTYKAPFFNRFAFYSKQSPNEVILGIHSARGGDINPAFQLLVSRGDLARLPDAGWENLLGNSQFDRFGRGSTRRMKGALAEELLYRIGRIRLNASEGETLDADGKKMIRQQTVIFAEDKNENMQSILDRAKDFVMRRPWVTAPVKVILSHSGTPEELKKWGYPKDLVVTSSGLTRPATDADFLGSLKVELTADERRQIGLPSGSSACGSALSLSEKGTN